MVITNNVLQNIISLQNLLLNSNKFLNSATLISAAFLSGGSWLLNVTMSKTDKSIPIVGTHQHIVDFIRFGAD